MDLKKFMGECDKYSNTHGFNFKWNDSPKYLILIITELSEAMEAWRDDNKTHFEEELADTFIRLLHMASQLVYKNTFEKMIRRKMCLNHKRPYHNGRKRQ